MREVDPNFFIYSNNFCCVWGRNYFYTGIIGSNMKTYIPNDLIAASADNFDEVTIWKER